MYVEQVESRGTRRKDLSFFLFLRAVHTVL